MSRKLLPRLSFVFGVTILTLTSCAPESVPSPATPSPVFASEEEAFAAAEETYRAYNEAGNSQRRGQDSEDALEFLTGDVLDSEIRSRADQEADGFHLEGDVVITQIDGVSVVENAENTEITSIVCLDISQVQLLTTAGENATPSDRDDLYGVRVTFVGDPSSLLISDYEVEAGYAC